MNTPAAWEATIANRARLDDCRTPHVFRDMVPHRVSDKRYVCLLCAGEVDGVERHWYALGLEHANHARPVPRTDAPPAEVDPMSPSTPTILEVPPETYE